MRWSRFVRNILGLGRNDPGPIPRISNVSTIRSMTTFPVQRPSGRRPSVPRPSEQHLPQFARASHIMGTARPSTILFNNAPDDFLQWRLTERNGAMNEPHIVDYNRTSHHVNLNVNPSRTSTFAPLNHRSKVLERARKSIAMQQNSVISNNERHTRVKKSTRRKKMPMKKLDNHFYSEILNMNNTQSESLQCWEEKEEKQSTSIKNSRRESLQDSEKMKDSPDERKTNLCPRGNRYESHPYGRKSSIRSISSSGSIVQFLFFGGSLDDITSDSHTADLCSLRRKVSNRLPMPPNLLEDKIPIKPTLASGLPALLFEPHFDQWW